jgi:hypothetical protein
MSQAEIGAWVQTHLRKQDIEVVLSGGAGVSIYSRGKYVSKDLDLVNIYSKDRKAIQSSMMELGFRERDGISNIRIQNSLLNFRPGR